MKQPVDIEATIKAAFDGMVEIISTKLERVKGKKTKQEVATLEREIKLLRLVAENPKKYFQIHDMPEDKHKLTNDLLEVSVLFGHYSPQSMQGTRWLDSLILYTADHYQDKVKKYDTNDKILELNKMIQLGRGSAMIRALNSIRSLAPVEHFAVRDNAK